MEAANTKRVHIEKAQNFFRQYRDPHGELRKLSANQFMEVWGHYDRDANGYIEGTELDGFLREFVSSANSSEVSPEVGAQHTSFIGPDVESSLGELPGVIRFYLSCCHVLSTDTHGCDTGGAEGLLHGGVRRQPRWQN